MKILVTGGAGFMGSSFIRRMRKTHCDVEIVTLDALTYASDMRSLSALSGDRLFKFVEGDISDRDLVFSLFEKENFDAVVNYAAETHVDNSIRSSSPFLISNVVGVGVLLDAVNRYGTKRFHQVSTDEVYGDLPLGSSSSFSEMSPIHPSNPYSASKASADLLCLSYFRTYGTPVTISRSVNNYGPFQNSEKLIPHSIRQIMRDEPVPIYGSGENIRSWIHVSDHSRAVERILFGGRVGEVYNISAGFEISNIELIRRILSIMGKSDDLISFVADRPGHDRRYSLDFAKLRSTFSFAPLISFDDGLSSTVRWYAENADFSEGV